AERIAPHYDLADRSLQAFLRWVSRERGWKLRFPDASVEASASSILLSGSLGKLTLDEALEAVLPTCRMTYRVQHGVLIVDPLPDADEESG
ncbi:MAG: hypothetical protein ACE5JG_11105, partial [Planctomycetota bacterium]